jgi:hypothetical protein
MTLLGERLCHVIVQLEHKFPYPGRRVRPNHLGMALDWAQNTAPIPSGKLHELKKRQNHTRALA